MQASKNKRLVDLFFSQEDPNNPIWMCKSGTKHRKFSSSYASLVSNVQTSHPELEHLPSAGNGAGSTYTETSQSSIGFFFQTTKAKKYFGWMDLIVNGLLPFASLQKGIFKQNLKRAPISLSSFMPLMSHPTEHIEKNIEKLLPS